MNHIVNISPLPFYPTLDMQNHRKDYAYGNVFPLVTYDNMLMPFQFIIPKRNYIFSIRMRSICGSISINLTEAIKGRGLIIKDVEGYSVVEYPGNLPITEITFEGQYYLEMIFANKEEGRVPTDLITRYSEVFCVKKDISNYIKLEYGNSHNLYLNDGVIDFADGFKFVVYLESELGKPNYSFEEEGTTRNGYLYIEHQVSKKVYQFTFTAPEYLLDALRVARLCDTRVIRDSLSKYYPLTLNIDSAWLEQGDLANVTIEFEVDNIISANGNHYLYEGDTPQTGVVFNNDFNNDFKK